MEREEKVKFWVKNADGALEMMDFLFKNKKYVDALFYGSLAVEKLMKGYFVFKKSEAPPCYILN
jgi:HEPN domain-containing protein